jgi:hypothetical protein
MRSSTALGNTQKFGGNDISPIAPGRSRLVDRRTSSTVGISPMPMRFTETRQVTRSQRKSPDVNFVPQFEQRRYRQMAPAPINMGHEQVFLEARTREEAERISPNRVRQVIVSPVRDQREQYMIAPAKEHYVAYVHDG